MLILLSAEVTNSKSTSMITALIALGTLLAMAVRKFTNKTGKAP
jgi:hypothetical protein